MTDTIENPLARNWRLNRGQLLKLVSVGLFAALGTFAVVQSIIGEKQTPAAAEETSAELANPDAAIQGLLADSSALGNENESAEATDALPPADSKPPIIPAGFQSDSGRSPVSSSAPEADSPAPKLSELNLVGAERKVSPGANVEASPVNTPPVVARSGIPALQPAALAPPGTRPPPLADSAVAKTNEFKLPARDDSAPAEERSPPGQSNALSAGSASVNRSETPVIVTQGSGNLPDSAPPNRSAGETLSDASSVAVQSGKRPADSASVPSLSPSAGAFPTSPNSLRSSSGGAGSTADFGGESPSASGNPSEGSRSFAAAPPTQSATSPAGLNGSPPSAGGRAETPPPSFFGLAATGAPATLTPPPVGGSAAAGLAVPGSGSNPPFQFGDQPPAGGSAPTNVAASAANAGGASSPAGELPPAQPAAVQPAAGSFGSPPENPRGVPANGIPANSSSNGSSNLLAGPGSLPANPVPPVATMPANRTSTAGAGNGLGPSGLGTSNGGGGGSPSGSFGSNPNPLGQNANLVRDGAIAAGGLPGAGSSPAAGGGLPGKSELEGEQVPALSIEKVAPREIQIDQPTDFRIIVKNVGRVVANEVRVTDQVPRGAQFIKSVPEASRGTAGSLVWELGSLKPGEERSVVLTLQPKQTGEIGSVAQVTFAAPASMRVLVTKPQLAVEHSGPAKVMIGDRVPLTINVRNLGNGPAKEVILQEIVPPQLKFAEDFNELEYEIGTLAPGESRKVNLNLSAAQIGRFRNTILVSGAGGLHAEHQIDMEVVAPQLQLSSEGPNRRYLKRNATHLFSVQNSGTAIATNLDLVTKLPKGVRFVSANNQGQYDPGSHAVYWSLDRLNVGQGASVQLTTTPEEPGEQALEFIATADLNQKASFRQPLLVEDLLELFFEIDDVEDVIEVGSETRYRIRLINQGTVTATNLQLSFSAEQGIRPVSVDNRLAGEVRGQEVVFAPVAEIRPGQELVTFVTAVGAAPGEHRIVARLRSEQREMNISKEESTRVYADR